MKIARKTRICAQGAQIAALVLFAIWLLRPQPSAGELETFVTWQLIAAVELALFAFVLHSLAAFLQSRSNARAVRQRLAAMGYPKRPAEDVPTGLSSPAPQRHMAPEARN